jgi:hypothetical protein
LPGLKWGTCLPGRATDAPVFGLRPMRGGRIVQRKTAEAADLDAFAGDSEPPSCRERLHGQIDIVGAQMRLAAARISISSDLVISTDKECCQQNARPCKHGTRRTANPCGTAYSDLPPS